MFSGSHIEADECTAFGNYRKCLALNDEVDPLVFDIDVHPCETRIGWQALE